MSLASRAVRATAYTLVGSYFNLLTGFVTTILLTRMLAPQVFGAVSLAAFFLGVVDIRGKFGFQHAFTQRQTDGRELIESFLAMQIVTGMATLVLCLLALPILHMQAFSVEVQLALLALGLVSFVDGLGSVPLMALEKDLRFRRTTAIVSTALFSSNITAIALAALGFGIWSLLAQMAVNATVSTVLCWLAFGSIVRPRIHRPTAMWMLRFSVAMVSGSVAVLVLLQFDNFLVGTIVGIAALGFYERAFKVAQWPTGLVTHVVSRTAFPTYAKLQEDGERLSKAFGLTLWLIVTFSLPLAVTLFVTAPDFIEIIFGEAWLPSAIYLRLLAGYSVLRPLIDDTGAFFTATGRPMQWTTTLSLQAATLVVCATPLTLAFGALGTAVGVGFAFVVGVLVSYRQVIRYVRISLRSVFLRPALAASAALAVYAVVRYGGDLNSLPLLVRFLVKVLFSGGTYVAVLLLLDYRMLADRTRYLWTQLRASGPR